MEPKFCPFLVYLVHAQPCSLRMATQAAESAARLLSHILSVPTTAAGTASMEAPTAVLNMPGVSHSLQGLTNALYLNR